MPKRELDLKDLDGVREEVQRLHTDGYEKTGAWDLSQICEHIAIPLRMAVDGSPFKANLFMRVMAQLFMKKKFFRERKIKPGLSAPNGTAFESSDEAAAVAKLNDAIQYFTNHTGPMADHPFFGKLSKEQWHDFNTIHCSHHLAFLVPKAEQA